MGKNLGFEYRECKFKYRAYFRNGKWEGGLETDKYIKVEESATVFHYGQSAFEGLKAFKHKNGKVFLFRPEENAKRLQNSCKKLMMAEVPTDMFVKACIEIVKANIDMVPEYGNGEALYLRPWVMGIGDNLGVKPAPEFLFGIFANPVGAYFAGGHNALPFVTSDFDRAAPNGTGHVKAGGNYAASFEAKAKAKEQGFADCIYLDPETHTKIDEIGAANFFGLTKNNEIITPKSNSVLPSITKYSILQVAKDYLGMTPIEGDCPINKLDMFEEAGACGTAAVITPIKSITHKGKEHVFGNGELGPKTKKLYDTLLGIQYGDIEGPKGWLVEVK